MAGAEESGRTNFPFIRLLEVWLGVICLLVAAGAFLATYLALHSRTSAGLAVGAGLGTALAVATPYLVLTALVHLSRQIADSTLRSQWRATAADRDT